MIAIDLTTPVEISSGSLKQQCYKFKLLREPSGFACQQPRDDELDLTHVRSNAWLLAGDFQCISMNTYKED